MTEPSPFLTEQSGDREEASAALDLPRTLLALAAAALAGLIGTWITHLLVSGTGLYIPLISGGLAGYAATLCCHRAPRLLALGVAVLSFVLAVFTETLIYQHDGTIAYLRGFLSNATGMDWLFRVANTLVGYWVTRSR